MVSFVVLWIEQLTHRTIISGDSLLEEIGKDETLPGGVRGGSSERARLVRQFPRDESSPSAGILLCDG